MLYNYDTSGWLTTTNTNRTTLVVPPVGFNTPIVGQLFPNWTGHMWELLVYSNPPLISINSDPVEDPRIWWIDVGPFKDRLGMDTLAIAASSHPVCLAVKEMLYDRKYVDLKDAKVTQLLDILIATNQPSAVVYFPGSGPMTNQKKDIIINTPTTEAERYIKDMV